MITIEGSIYGGFILHIETQWVLQPHNSVHCIAFQFTLKPSKTYLKLNEHSHRKHRSISSINIGPKPYPPPPAFDNRFLMRKP